MTLDQRRRELGICGRFDLKPLSVFDLREPVSLVAPRSITFKPPLRRTLPIVATIFVGLTSAGAVTRVVTSHSVGPGLKPAKESS